MLSAGLKSPEEVEVVALGAAVLCQVVNLPLPLSPPPLLPGRPSLQGRAGLLLPPQPRLQGSRLPHAPAPAPPGVGQLQGAAAVRQWAPPGTQRLELAQGEAGDVSWSLGSAGISHSDGKPLDAHHRSSHVDSGIDVFDGHMDSIEDSACNYVKGRRGCIRLVHSPTAGYFPSTHPSILHPLSPL